MTSTVGPVSERERVFELDVLRGIALFGVLTMNFVAFAGAGVMATDAQMAALPTVKLDQAASFLVRVLIGDKANTTFAVLFGLGFYLQMKRSEGTPGFERRYSRRLFWLLVFGWANALFLWIWDILNLYAVAGFALLMMRRWRTRTLVVVGTIMALYSDHLQNWITGSLGLKLVPDWLYEDPAILARQAVAVGGDYPGIFATFTNWTYTEWLAGGLMVAYLVYALGRFALGAAIGRSGILNDVDAHRRLLRRIAWVALPVGLAANLVIWSIIKFEWRPFGPDLDPLAQTLRSPAALTLAAGYASAIVVALGKPWGRKLFGVFAPVGRMALTNYLAQGLIYAFVLFGVGFGLGLAGRIGSAAVLAICILFFAFQTVFSQWWLARYRFGPMEYVWRTLTYGQRPQMRRLNQGALAAA